MIKATCSRWKWLRFHLFSLKFIDLGHLRGPLSLASRHLATVSRLQGTRGRKWNQLQLQKMRSGGLKLKRRCYLTFGSRKTTEGLDLIFSDVRLCSQWFAVEMLGGYRALQNCDWWNGHPQLSRWNFSWKPKLGVPIGLDLHRNCLNNFQTHGSFPISLSSWINKSSSEHKNYLGVSENGV